MLRSLITSARGKSALHGSATPYTPTPTALLPERPAPAAIAVHASPPASAGAPETSPDRCCVYCGHPLFAGPRAAKVRCPKCFQELSARHITLHDGLAESRIVTSGKIIVPAGTRVAAELIACSVDVAGMVLGDILASHTCHIRAGGKIAGRILCRRLDLEPGAELQGQVELIQK